MKRFPEKSLRILNTLNRLGTQGVLISVLVLVVISLFLFPLQKNLLDLFIATNILIAIVLLLRGLFVNEPVKLFAFPSILLLSTFFRLALNVSSTRLILLNGDQGLDAAGSIIQSFGSFVIKGDFVVGVIIFILIAVINFVVIAKGSARVAEVAARFTLDAMPGRQLAIDSDLRSGNITRGEAVKKREELNQESQFYGAMDGAMKFVQGDAIAGLIITAVNAIGGVSIGVSRGLSFSDAIDTFGVLTIGDGLVSIIPALLISLCTGIIVTHVNGKQAKGSSAAIFSQVLDEPRALVIAGLTLLILSLMPGFPFLPFFLVGFLVLSLFLLAKFSSVGSEFSVQDYSTIDMSSPDLSPQINWTGQALLNAPNKDEKSFFNNIWSESLAVSTDSTHNVITLELDQKVLAPMIYDVHQNSFNALNHYIHDLWQHVSNTRGIQLPSLEFKIRSNLSPSCYRVLIRGQELKSASIKPELSLALCSESTLALFGIEAKGDTFNPLSGSSACWIDSDSSSLSSLGELGVEVLSFDQFLIVEAVGSALEVVDEIFGLDEVKRLVEPLIPRYRGLIEEVFHSEVLSYPEFTEVLRRLVREKVNIKDMKLIIEGVAEYYSLYPDFENRQEWLNELHSFLRIVMSRSIVADAILPGDKLRVFLLDDVLTKEFRSLLSVWDYGRLKPPVSKEVEESVISNANKLFRPLAQRGAVPIVILCDTDIRPAVNEFFSGLLEYSSSLRTISKDEINNRVKMEYVGLISS